MRHLRDVPDHELVGAVVGQIADEVAVDLEPVERHMLEVVEGGEAGAEVVQGEAAAEVSERPGKAPHVLHVGDRGGLCDLEDQRSGIDSPGDD